jgi:predicted NUDIX family NTP pyrophosphohydrolase
MEWPPRSGRLQSFPEVDRAAWFPLEVARVKLHRGQVGFADELAQMLATGQSCR